jgi:ribonuclease PH
MQRPSLRADNELRKVSIETNINKHAEGSCLIKSGDTHVICTASLDEKVPSWLRGQGRGWITAEYGMLPRATGSRMNREAKRGQSGRTQEIQRLIGRSLRACVDLYALGEKQIIIDCDVLQADGGTRTAAINGGFVALSMAIKHLLQKKQIPISPLQHNIAAISCGNINNKIITDLNYAQDSNADVDANFVISEQKEILELQYTAEKNSFSYTQMTEMYHQAEKAILEIIEIQRNILNTQ